MTYLRELHLCLKPLPAGVKSQSVGLAVVLLLLIDTAVFKRNGGYYQSLNISKQFLLLLFLYSVNYHSFSGPHPAFHVCCTKIFYRTNDTIDFVQTHLKGWYKKIECRNAPMQNEVLD